MYDIKILQSSGLLIMKYTNYLSLVVAIAAAKIVIVV